MIFAITQMVINGQIGIVTGRSTGGPREFSLRLFLRSRLFAGHSERKWKPHDLRNHANGDQWSDRNSGGEVDWWPEGVFSEAFLEVKAIRRAQRKKMEAS